MKQSILFYLLFLFSNIQLLGQLYPDHFGTGNNIGLTVTSSNPNADSTAVHSLSGKGYLVDTVGAYRFLAQAGFGGDSLQIDTLLQLGIEDWLEWQMTMPYETFFDRYFTIKNDIVAGMYQTTMYIEDSAIVQNTNWTKYTPMVFYDKVLNDKDIVRQKAAFALSQIFVTKLITAIEPRRIKGDSYAKYYDILYEGAFGNFRDILEDVTLSAVMGDYLTYFQNRKADSTYSIQPDENYAREIMQLFTIGLNELNNDGTLKVDANCNAIPTYNIEDITEMAQVFTGLYGAAIDSVYIDNVDYNFTRRVDYYDWDLPMVMDSSYHDTSTKILPDGDTIPANQDGMDDIEMALDWLFNHNNVGPFIARRLIQQLVKSNPTPAYINRVATAFNNNGNGVRGDMGAVFRAILLDIEARDCEWINDPHTGKLLQPMERNINLFKAFGVHTPSGTIRFQDFNTSNSNKGEELLVMQAFLKAPSVFNFFSPFYAESEFVDSAGLVSPEFEILNSVTSIHYLNRTRDMIERMGKRLGTYTQSINDLYYTSPFMNMSRYAVSSGKIYLHFNQDDKPELDFRDEVCICENQDIEALLDHLDIVLCRGQLSTQTKDLILNNIETQMTIDVADYQASLKWYTINQPDLEYTCLDETEEFDCLRIVKEMVYFIMLSPDYIILK